MKKQIFEEAPILLNFKDFNFRKRAIIVARHTNKGRYGPASPLDRLALRFSRIHIYRLLIIKTLLDKVTTEEILSEIV